MVNRPMAAIGMNSRNTRQYPAAPNGFTYITVLFMLAVFSGSLALVGEVWQTASQRDKEAELLFVGNQYRKAIERYFLTGQRHYPFNLDDLVNDRRSPASAQHLRNRYADPLAGDGEWGLVKAPDGGIMGVFSRSEDRPLKTANFKARDRGFENARRYSDWKFIYSPDQVVNAATPTSVAPPVK
jgi:type II secretory pathway pseudopilin PulG